jgi:hypothetical protein
MFYSLPFFLISNNERDLYLNTIFLGKPSSNFDVIEMCKLL